MAPEDLTRYARDTFGDMAKIAVDIERGIIAIGCRIHAECRDMLVNDGSRTSDVWGASVFPDRKGEERISYISTSVNPQLQPDKPVAEIASVDIRDCVREIVERLLLAEEHSD